MPHSQEDLHKKLLGRRGERAAQKFLKKQGAEILETNLRTPFGEADVVALCGETLIFAEVKTRTREDYGAASEAVNAKKRERYQKIASWYLQKENLADEYFVRFDVVEVYPGGVPVEELTGEERASARLKKDGKHCKSKIRHLPAAFD